MVPASIKFFFIQVNYRVWIHSETWTLHDNNMSQMHRTDKYSQQSSIIWPVWLNGWVFVYELSGYGFESRSCHIKIYVNSYFDTVFWNVRGEEVKSHIGTEGVHFKYIILMKCYFQYFILNKNCLTHFSLKFWKKILGFLSSRLS